MATRGPQTIVCVPSAALGLAAAAAEATVVNSSMTSKHWSREEEKREPPFIFSHNGSVIAKVYAHTQHMCIRRVEENASGRICV